MGEKQGWHAVDQSPTDSAAVKESVELYFDPSPPMTSWHVIGRTFN
jgi:hypothetical protein